MADLKLDIVVYPTYNILSLAIIDASIYPDDPPIVSNPTIDICVPGFETVTLPFVIDSYNLFTSDILGITETGIEQALPDGIYYIKYYIDPPTTSYVEKSIMRVDAIQEKFDKAFMQLDMLECDQKLKKQARETLDTIYYFIQGSIASANNCAILQSERLYTTANNMLTNFLNINGGCS